MSGTGVAGTGVAVEEISIGEAVSVGEGVSVGAEVNVGLGVALGPDTGVSVARVASGVNVPGIHPVTTSINITATIPARRTKL